MSWSKAGRRLLINPLTSRRHSAILFILWIFVIIILFYKLTNNEQSKYTTIGPIINSNTDHFDEIESSKFKKIDNYEQIKKQVTEGGELESNENKIRIEQSSNGDVIEDANAYGHNNKRWIANNQLRNGKVFILLIEDEKLDRYQSSSRNRAKDKRRQLRPDLDSDLPNHDWDISLPDHIAVVIEILESHRIAYTLGSTRNGMPSSLFADTKDSLSGKDIQYSVIIMDDFMKYTRLNRWLRDQIDRHCRKNNIGVVTYLTNPPIISESKSTPTKSMADKQIFTTNSLQTTFSIGDNSHISDNDIKDLDGPSALITSGAAAATAEEKSHAADQFPISFQPIHQNSCKLRAASSRSCLSDYQLNDRSTILRILKRRPNFILRGPLIRNLNHSPWISISTNHITYEPLTWATLVRSNTSRDNPNSNIDITQSADISRIDNNDVNSFGHSNKNIDDGSRGQNSNDSNRRFKRAAIGQAAVIVSSVSTDSDNSSNSDLMNLESSEANSEQDVLASSDDLSITDQTNESDNGLNEFDNDKAALVGDAGIRQDQLSDTPATTYESMDIQTLSLYDRGLFDGIKRVIFGGANHHWLNRILLLDSIEHLSGGRILSPLDRFVQIDIDDIFVGEKGTKLTSADVDALIAQQASIAQHYLPQFKFNLGYSGAFYQRGLESEKEGDRRLVQSRANFTWFCHTWAHKKAHLFNDTQALELELSKNLEFARQHELPTTMLLIGNETESSSDRKPIGSSYAIAPHHSGVYPIHEQLYDAWKRVLNVQVTSTEEYPHLRPASARRAFVHKNIKVLPRQTCGLYTHTILKSKYPGGFKRLLQNIDGGELFQSVLHNPVNIYMTHQSNYAHDRLALITFERLFRFIQLHTNLQLRFEPENRPLREPGAIALANYYFSLYPTEQQEPIWTNPCSDLRHLAIWSSQKHSLCRYAPKLLIVGPQKSGTTALLEFLQMSDQIRSSSVEPSLDFEEIQFFNEKHYWRGVDWYLDRFKPLNESTTFDNKENELDEQDLLFVDKSATYFDDPKAPQRAHALLPDSKIVIMLINPADRAYSWFQHQRAHNDPMATQYSFEQVIKSGSSKNDDEQDYKLKALRNRCLTPGFYSSHLSRWLDFYSSRQIIIIDGQWFRTNPPAVLNKLQTILRLDKKVDYRKLLYFEPRKGFYCQKVHRRSHCLGASKGRRYEPMSADARLYLNRLYYGHNRQLARILIDIGQPLPAWLLQATSSSSLSYNYVK